jgi:hypothetical protein
MYSDFEEAFIQTVDKHAPVKQRKPCQNPAPFRGGSRISS